MWLTYRVDIANNFKDHISVISRSTNPIILSDPMSAIQTYVSETDHNALLLSIPSESQIKDIAFKMKPWTSPGPDGFPPGF